MFIRTEKSIKDFVRFYPVITTLVIIHIILWLIIDLLHLPIGRTLFGWGAGNNFLIHQGEYWRLFTSIFLHAGLMHTLFNSFALVIFGPALEQMLGRLKFAITYLACGVIANLIPYFIDPTSFTFYVGASGAIYGLFGIYVYMVVLRRDLITQSDAQIITTIFFIGLIMTFIQPGINIYAHIFGFIGGFALARMVLVGIQPFSQRPATSTHKQAQFNPNRRERKSFSLRGKSQLIFWIVLGILVLLGIFGR